MESLEEALAKVLNRPFDDEGEVVSLLVQAITFKCTDTDLIEQAVKQTIDDYENKLRVFMVGVANAQLQRILRMINMLGNIESELEKNRVNLLRDSDLIKLYATTQTALMQSLDYVKKIVDMRVEKDVAQSIVAKNMEQTKATQNQNLMLLPAAARNRLRKVIECVVASGAQQETIGSDTSEDNE